MKALVAVSSKHGATAGIGDQIAATLRAAGITVDQVAPEHVRSVNDYDAIVVGSALYMGRWMSPARDFVTAYANELAKRRVLLFASGAVKATAKG